MRIDYQSNEALLHRMDRLERENRRGRAAMAVLAAGMVSVVILGLVPARVDAQRNLGPLTAEGGLYITKNGVLRAQLAVDDTNRVQLALYGTSGSAGVPPLADLLQQVGFAAVNQDPVILLTAGTKGTAINITGGPTKSNIVIGTTDTAGPSVVLYNGNQVSDPGQTILEMQGAANGQALFAINGHFAAIDDHGKKIWSAPAEEMPIVPAPTVETP